MAPFTLRWGIISTGNIATTFCKDLLVDPCTRNASDVHHQITAIGSRSVPSAEGFLTKLKESAIDHFEWGIKNGALEGCKPYGSYEEVYNDPNVDVVYIATPHTYHHRNCKDALLAGKNVLCEKPFTLDEEELEELIGIAREKGLFLMEAVWTRFQPITYAIQDIVASGKLGKLKRLTVDNSLDFRLDEKEETHRMLDPALGGGALLDLGPYPLVWAMLILHHHPLNSSRSPPKILNSYQTLYPRTGVDSATRMLLEWEGVGQAALTADLTCHGYMDGVAVITFEEGDILIVAPPSKPQTFHIVPHGPDPSRQGLIKTKTTHRYPLSPGHGMAYEADEVARCIRDGKKESERMPLKESLVVMRILDQVRRNGGTKTRDLRGTAGQ
ncbi:hypothetical protein CI109_101427 [Kwoniella shandongensis]|uniref:D-xylose 1-dehydrogenase (NADP(+), D-xylono-1,5-lactone-forming) n=1 Tax=Kwoniella shandongensis TaxID=1734106 RepID=A0A5M6BUM1_9TREE|nr:uncharacterized protein CI109_005123 [Kwoniella shandongensis]KAA5526547.1 hypothetical protein CI109_005123 [Kwoniella shandongensis]